MQKTNQENPDATAELHTWAAGSSPYAVQRVIKAIADVEEINSKDVDGKTPLDLENSKIADLLRKHGGKTGEELKAEGK